MIRYITILLLLLSFSCKSDKRYHDEQQPLAVPEQSLNYSEEIASLRAKKDKTFKNGETSPLLKAQKHAFTRLDYYGPDTTYVVQARLEVAADPEVAILPTTTNMEQAQLVYGVLHFTLRDQKFQLNVYRDPALVQEAGYEDYLFLPFTDLTNGNTTYGGGRYLDLEIPEGTSLTLDFNKAYNPYCAYNAKYSCPLVPRENHLEIAVEAGEKKFDVGE
ncbi:DUF1684 domain-containing protein [Robertkochia sediminum]|uniref:DUF1684 domain-containing protein n=1 Tax=Robertkochia sediminum TaxID=2785326 RepID=UPI001934107B|nr:DUF1684 domain-containing protein [Robertkochia sediminum]MBL7472287.1 DUF1684 domain-containing protein [Robertkochia sediminum]